jgi:hypothetical protein
VLEVCKDLEVANLAEDSWIELYDTRNPEKGFNLVKGGSHTPHPVKNAYWQDPEYWAKQLPRLKALANDPRLHEAMRAGMATLESKAKRSASSKALWTEEHRARMSAISREVQSRPEVREKNAAAHRGRKLSPEHIEKCASARRGKSIPEENRLKLSEAMKGRKLTAEHLANMSRSQIGKKLSPETKEKIAASHRGKPLSPEHRAKIAASLMKRKKAKQTDRPPGVNFFRALMARGVEENYYARRIRSY